jgi:hypothetical protein
VEEEAAEVSDAEIEEYYSEYVEDFSTTDTNGEFVVSPLDEVRTNVVQILARKRAAAGARDGSIRLVKALMPDRYGNALSMDQVAGNMGLTISTSEFFAIDQELTNLEVGLDFNRTAFGLNPNDPEGYYSDSITGTNAVYVIAPGIRRESRIPEFEEVVDGVMPFAQRLAELKAFDSKMEDIREKLSKSIEGGGTFDDSLKDLSMGTSTTVTFSAYSAVPEEMEYYEELVPAVIVMDKGELSEAIFTEQGALLAYVSDRRAGDMSSMDFIRIQLLNRVDQVRSGMVMEDWERHVLAQAGKVDLMRSASTADEDKAE